MDTQDIKSPENALRSEQLAPWTYCNEEFFALEKEYLFKRQWLLAGHINDIPAPRDYLTFTAFGERALILRDNDGELRAFHNICRHRGARLVDGTRGQCAPLITCPFHGWTYNLDGSLLSAPKAHTFADLKQNQIHLTPLPVEIWMGFIFVCFAGAKNLPQSVAAQMQPVEHLLRPYQLPNLHPLAQPSEDLCSVNWKTIHDIDNEGYHVPCGHPTLQQLYGKDYCDKDIGGVAVATGYLNDKPGKLWSVKQYHKHLPTYAHLPAEQQRLWLYVGIFPSMVLALYPDSVEFYMTIPCTVDTTRVLGGTYGLLNDSRETRAMRYLSKRINRVTAYEDETFVQRLQDGLNSSARPTPRLSSLEQGVLRFHKKIQQVLPVANLANAPMPGRVGTTNIEVGKN